MHSLSILFLRLSAIDVCERIKKLFSGFENLIKGFNTFLPTEYQISIQQSEIGNRNAQSHGSISSLDPSESTSFKKAMAFIQNIKERFPSDSQVYEEFLETLHLYKERVLDLDGVYDRARSLIGEHEDSEKFFIHV